MANSKVENAVILIEETFVGMNEGAEIADLSPVYFRRNVEKLEEDRGSLKRLIFGKQVIERVVAEEVKSAVATAKAERELKAQAKRDKKVEKTEQSGPTLLDLKYHAKKAGLKIGRLNKAELVTLLGANDVVIEGFSIEAEAANDQE